MIVYSFIDWILKYQCIITTNFKLSKTSLILQRHESPRVHTAASLLRLSTKLRLLNFSDLRKFFKMTVVCYIYGMFVKLNKIHGRLVQIFSMLLQYKISVKENVQVDHVIVHVVARSLDIGANGRLRYSFARGNEHNKFAINSDTGGHFY